MIRNTISPQPLLFLIFAALMSPFSAEAQEKSLALREDRIIVSVIGGRVRSEPSLKSKILRELNIGTRLPLLEEKSGWYRIELKAKTDDAKAETGWISRTISERFEESNADAIFQRIADRYLKRESKSFATAVQLLGFLGAAADDAKTYEVGGDLRLKRLTVLASAISQINYEKAGISPFREFIDKHTDEVIYHEPAGMWIVRSNRYWQLHERYKRYKVGETIAWQAAKNPLPGECEGYIVCHLNYLRVTVGEYLNFYPNGRFTREALLDLANLLEPMVADLPEKQTYTAASDISDRAAFNQTLTELRNIVSRTPLTEKSRILGQISGIAEGYR